MLLTIMHDPKSLKLLLQYQPVTPSPIYPLNLEEDVKVVNFNPNMTPTTLLLPTMPV